MELFKNRFTVRYNNLLYASLLKINQLIKNPVFLFYKMILKRILAISSVFVILLLINQIFAQTNNEEDYNRAIFTADQYFADGDYINAKASYQYASRIKPDEEYPKDKLRETVDKLREKMVVMEQYNSVLSEADRHYKLKEYEQAKEKYQAAQKILPEESYPNERLTEIERIVSEADAKQAEYDAAVSNGDKYLKFGKLIQAKAEFEKATAVFPEEKYPIEKIAELEILIVEAEKVQTAYDESIAGADRLFNLKYYENAKQDYEKASAIKPEEDYPPAKIKEIDEILIEKNKFDQLIGEADEFYMSKNLESAKSKYQEALTIYPAESYPKGMIDKINTSLNALRGKDEVYKKAIADADDFFNSKDYINSIKEYENASNIKPEEQYPKQKIQEVNDLIAKIEADELNYNLSVQKGEQYLTQKEYFLSKDEFEKANKLKPDEQYPKDKLAELSVVLKGQQDIQDSYDNTIAQADAYVESKEYDNAIAEYEKALVYIPGAKYAKDKIDEVNLKKVNKLEKDKQYEKLIVKADKLFEKLDYEGAKIEFENAANLKPNESYPPEKIDIINAMLSEQNAQQNSYQQFIDAGDKFFSESKYDLAKIEYQNALEIKPDEKYPIAKIDEINKILENKVFTMNLYSQTIASADLLMAEGKYFKATQEYEKASSMQPTNQYPKEKIFEINKLITEQKAVDEQYNKAVADADNHYKQRYYDQALTRYQDATLLKPDEKHTQDRIIEITALLAGMAKDNQSYTDAVSEADGFFALKNYEEAKLSYMKASNIKSKEQYPKDKIEEIEQLISNQKAIQAEYNRIIAIADRMMVSKEYDNAKEKYSEALIILPGEEYPTGKLKEIDGIILSQELAIQETYNNIIAEADALFGSQMYRQSKIKYQDALKYKPNEEYPVQKIAEVERLVSDLETLQANYSRLIATADKLFKSKDYQDAKPIYVEASALFPDEEYPKSKIEEINLIFKAEMQQIQMAYDKAVADADKFFSASVFDKALDSYRNAKEIKSDEIYPGQMITSIMKILDENAVRDVVTSAVTIENNSQKKFDFSPISVSDRKSSLLFIKAKNISETEFKVVLGYGKGGSKNGGYILPIPAGQNTKEYIIPIGKQYTWFTEDNDWISITPQGGSVEISLIKISRGK